MSTQRIYIGADRVTVSKPGYDAVSPPAVDYKYLALDSRLGQGRPLEVGLIPTLAINQIIPFTTTYPAIPGVEVVAWSAGSIAGFGDFVGYTQPIVMRDGVTTAYQRSHFYLGIWPYQFQIVSDAVSVQSSIFNGSKAGFYIVWQTW